MCGACGGSRAAKRRGQRSQTGAMPALLPRGHESRQVLIRQSRKIERKKHCVLPLYRTHGRDQYVVAIKIRKEAGEWSAMFPLAAPALVCEGGEGAGVCAQ